MPQKLKCSTLKDQAEKKVRGIIQSCPIAPGKRGTFHSCTKPGHSDGQYDRGYDPWSLPLQEGLASSLVA